MTLSSLASRVRRTLHKPPAYVARRILGEARHELDRFTQPRFGQRFGLRQLVERSQARDLDELWARVIGSPGWPFAPTPSPADYEACCPGDTARIVAAAERAMRHEIDLLGSGPVSLGRKIDWHRDYKTGDRWPLGYFRGIDYINRGRPSDVKTVWELSRLHWVLPCGQAYSLTGDERYAEAVRDILEQWIDANPYACSVNWGVTMEPALRIISWCALLRLCGSSRAWSGDAFRTKFLCSCYLHAIFTERFIERSEVNGNHFAADAAAMIIAGALFAQGQDAKRWLESGLVDMEREVLLQVHPDGVDFEASTAYHRLVTELFLAASMAVEAAGRTTSASYRQRLAAMARFTAAYMRPDATAPIWGDHDDARTLPMGPQEIRDHSYLIGLVALHLHDSSLVALASGCRSEACWWFGTGKASQLSEMCAGTLPRGFPDGGVYIIRSDRDHIFIDCGPVGLAGRGGHGHNDILSLEAFLVGVPLITEGGCYVYTADFASRNLDRSTASHNTPIVDGAEINRFRGPDEIWTLTPDAEFEDVVFVADAERARFRGRHTGYRRLPGAVTVTREVRYESATHALEIIDLIDGSGTHAVEVPLHLEPGTTVKQRSNCAIDLVSAGQCFELQWIEGTWRVFISESRVAASYGTWARGPLIRWRAEGPLPLELHVRISYAGPLRRYGYESAR